MEVHLILPNLPSRERSASVRRDLLNKATTRAPERSNCIFNQPASIIALLNISSYEIAVTYAPGRSKCIFNRTENILTLSNIPSFGIVC